MSRPSDRSETGQAAARPGRRRASWSRKTPVWAITCGRCMSAPTSVVEDEGSRVVGKARPELKGGRMQRVEQPDGTGCGLACVAMLAGRSYATVKEKAIKLTLYDGFGTKRNYRTLARHLRRLGEAYSLCLGPRVEFARRRRHVRTSLDEFERYMKAREPSAHALVATHRKEDEWHWVVWDSDRGRLLDPRKPPRTRDIRPWYYIRVRYTKRA